MTESYRTSGRRRLLTATVALFISACASGPSFPPEDDLKTLTGRFAEEPVTKPLNAVEAYVGDEQLFLSYES
ncbi:MAG: hypothetical protein WBN07_10000 [Woeseiaceae bacterium]